MTESDLPPLDPEYRANLSQANLKGASLLRSRLLHSADFLDAVGLTVPQVAEAETDEPTRWPTYLREAMSK
jgi:hypothetical protein